MPTVVFANIFQPLIDVFEAVLKFFHDTAGLGWGTSIIALTIVVRAALVPLTLKQFRSMQALARLQPEIKALQERHKDDRQRLNQEMMRFYQENKVNPFGSCLPLLLQLPVFLSLFYMLKRDLRLDICGQAVRPCGEVSPGSAEFFFIPDLTNKATGAVLVTLIVLYVGSQLVSSVLMSVSTDKTQQRLMIVLPFFFVAFIWQFPAGLLVYWITTNLWTIVQQQIVRRRVGPMHAPKAEPAAGAAGGGRSAGTPSPRQAPPPPPRKKKKRSGRRR